MTKKDTPRSCGECSECCTIVSVCSDSPFNREHPDIPIWFKPMRKACQFITPNGGGCRIYEDRPANCRGWTCEWLTGAPIRKPTESGVIFFAERTKYGQTVMVGAKTDEAYEDEETKEEIQRYRDLGYPVLLMHDDGKRTLIE